MKVFQYAYYFIRSIKSRGLINTFKLLYYENKYEKQLGINTHRIVNLNNLTLAGTNSEQNHHYQGASYFVLYTIFNKLPAHLKQKPFIDFGCGKGRALFVAEQCGFTNCIGVDIAKELIDVANENKLHYVKKNKLSIINFIFEDATTFAIPNDAEVFYFFNPFGPAILKQVLLNIKKSVVHNPRKIYCLYLNPIHHQVFIEMCFEVDYKEINYRYTEAIVYSFSFQLET